MEITAVKELLKLHGAEISCELNRDRIDFARIAVEESKIYVCQDTFDGADAKNKLGYQYSWFIADADYTCVGGGCTNIKLLNELSTNQKRRTGMNYSTAVMLINEKIRAVKVIYEHEDNKHQTKYIFKTLDETIDVGDFVTIPTDTRHKMTVVKVVEVLNTDVDIDFEDTKEIKWIIDKVGTENSDYILEEEKKWIEELKKSEKRKKTQDLKKNMEEMWEDAGVSTMAIANMSSEGLAVIEAPTKKEEA